LTLAACSFFFISVGLEPAPVINKYYRVLNSSTHKFLSSLRPLGSTRASCNGPWARPVSSHRHCPRGFASSNRLIPGLTATVQQYAPRTSVVRPGISSSCTKIRMTNPINNTTTSCPTGWQIYRPETRNEVLQLPEVV